MTNLPVLGTPFVGRAQDLAEIARLLSDSACRLLTLVGPGGIGKTRLALESARQTTLPDGVHFVPLQPLESPDYMVSAIAEAIHFQFYPGSEPEQQLLDYLREKSLLLVLDNLEHLLDGIQLLSEILAYAPNLRIMATSRERLNLVEEWILEVEGLPFPRDSVKASMEDYGALQLFAQRARQVQARFSLAEDAGEVTRICRLVGGMPLGIELAAARMRVLSCQQIADEIERSLDILETPARNVELRHRNIRAVFEPTWDRLSEKEREVFRKLSLFRGGFTREAADYVAGATLPTLSALVDKSLLRVDPTGRYDIHELLRQYGEDQLNASREGREQARDLHSAYYAEFMHQQLGNLRTHRQRMAQNEMETEIDNVRAAWRCMVEKCKVTEIHKSAQRLAGYLGSRYLFQEALELLDQAAIVLRSSSPEQETEVVLGLVLALQSGAYANIIALDKAKALAEEGLSILERLGSPEERMLALDSLAFVTHLLQNPLPKTMQIIQAGLTLARTNGSQWWVANFLISAAEGAQIQHQYAEATQMAEEGLSIAEQYDAPSLIAHFYLLLGGIAFDQGDYSLAKRRHEQALHYFQETDFLWGEAMCYLGLAKIAVSLKDFAHARRYFRQELEIDFAVGHRRWQTDTILNITQLRVAEDEKERAIELLILVHQHPATMSSNRDIAGRRLDKLQTELTPDVFTTAVERGRARDLEITVKELIAEFSQPVAGAAPLPAAHRLPDSLTERELEILRLIAAGLSNREIADQRVLAMSTVKWYINQIFSKLQVTSRAQAIVQARALGLLPSE